VRVLLDENLPHDLIAPLSKHQVSTVQGKGWAGVENGELLRRATGQADAFITMDRRLQHEQNLTGLPFGVGSSWRGPIAFKISSRWFPRFLQLWIESGLAN
jgi:hypothetical protein